MSLLSLLVAPVGFALASAAVNNGDVELQPIALVNDEDYVQIPASCDQITQNGLFYIKPTTDGPVIPVFCSNRYTMLDASLDTNLESYPSYLTSWTYTRRGWLGSIMPDLDDLSTYRDWYTPADEDTSFHIANDCSTCEASSDFGDNSAYYTSSVLFCYAGMVTLPCEDALSDHACNTCDTGADYNRCTAMQMDADTPIDNDHVMCVTRGLSYRPVMSLLRDACTCYKQNNAPTTNTFAVDKATLPKVTMDRSARADVKFISPDIVFDDEDDVELPKDMTHCDETKIYLSNKDFVEGTYRIQECGSYILTEDIKLNFAASPDQYNPESSPNSIDIDDLFWYPRQDQEEMYPGTYTHAGTYALGFFAGIAIEADYVKIDLNGYTLAMAKPFYLQQRFFTLISVAAKYFLPNQGPSNWLIEGEFFPHHVEIFGGKLGLTSHHGIHGMQSNHLYIHDIDVTAFEIAGIQCNGCSDLRLERATVGPMYTDIPVLGRYGTARGMLPRFQQLGDLYGDRMMTFSNRKHAVSVSDLLTRLINQMDMMFHYYVNDIRYDEDDEEWIAAKKMFVNPTGWMDGGSTYGLVFNGDGAAVPGIGFRTEDSEDIKIRDVEVFGVYNQVLEKMQTIEKTGMRTRLVIFDTIDWINVVDQTEDGGKALYIGDAYTDLIFAIIEHIDSWAYLNALFISQEEIDFARHDKPYRDIWGGGSPAANDNSANGCNTDILLHSVKGAIGVRFDGQQNIDVDGLYIHDVVNWADLGSNWCGEYMYPDIRDELPDIQWGYTGTRAHGLVLDWAQGSFKNVRVEKVESFRGEANGVVVYKNCDVEFEGLSVADVQAGTHLSMKQVESLSLPNLVPRACAVDVRDETIAEFVDQVEQSNVNGYDNCVDEMEGDKVLAHKMVVSETSMSVVEMAVTVVVVAVLMLAGFGAYFVCAKMPKGLKMTTGSQEHTPLLKQ